VFIGVGGDKAILARYFENGVHADVIVGELQHQLISYLNQDLKRKEGLQFEHMFPKMLAGEEALTG
jgi:hypothetical protein